METYYEFEKRMGDVLIENGENRFVERKVAVGLEKLKPILTTYYYESLNCSLSMRDYLNAIEDLDEIMAWEDTDF